MTRNELPKTIVHRGPRMLPRVTLTNGKTYFIDERLNQLRNIKNPHDYIDDYMSVLRIIDIEKVHWCAHRFTDFITVSCSTCGKVLFTGTEHQAKGLSIYCTECASK